MTTPHIPPSGKTESVPFRLLAWLLRHSNVGVTWRVRWIAEADLDRRVREAGERWDQEHARL